MYKVGRTDRDIFDRFKEYPKGSRILYCEHVPCSCTARLEAKVLKVFRLRFRARCDIGAESFQGDWEEMAGTVREVVSADRLHIAKAKDITRRTGFSSTADYDQLIRRFLQHNEHSFHGKTLPIEELERMFSDFAPESPPLLRENLSRLCREIGAVTHEHLEVRFRDHGEHSLLDAAMHFRSFALVPSNVCDRV